MDYCRLCQELLHCLTNLHNDTLPHDKQRIKQLLEKLACLKDALKLKNHRENVPEQLLLVLCSCYMQLLDQITDIFTKTASVIDPEDYDILDLATEITRCLRNVSAGCQKNQNNIAKQTDLFKRLHCTVESCCLFIKKSATDVNKEFTLLRCIIQMLGNLAAGNKQVGLIIWNCFFNLFSKCFDLGDSQLSSYNCMLIHTCYLADPATLLDQLVATSAGQQLISAILKYLTREDSEWGLFIIESVLSSSHLLENIWNQLDVAEKNLLLDIMLNQLDKGSCCRQNSQQTGKQTEDASVPTEVILYISKIFKEKAYIILGLNRSTPTGSENLQESLLLSKELSILCTATAIRDTYVDVIQDTDLLRCAINLLQCMKVIGEEGNNVFSPICKVSDLDRADLSHPACGLKRDLIRLLANMVYKNKVNQDKVREFGGINLILDHTNIDGRNPFITQWSVFAIHNLLESNPENQAIVSGMRLEGLSDNVEQLRDFGVEAELEGDRIVVRNVDVKKTVSPFSKLYQDEG